MPRKTGNRDATMKLTEKIKLAETIKEIRKTKGQTQRAAARCIGVSNVHLCYVERGKKSPSLKLLERMHKAWGIDPYLLAWLLYNEFDDEPANIRKLLTELRQALLAKYDRKGSDEEG